LGHSWQDATCTTPTTCATCGITQGGSLGHTWQGGSSTAPATCSVCGVVQETATGGTTGDCTWRLDGTVLTISGNGKMADYTDSSWAPWGTKITAVNIEEGVTTIGYMAFYQCTSLTSVTIPTSVTIIGFRAFKNCEKLTSVYIPDGVTTIGTEAFAFCYSLTTAFIGDGVTRIARYAFNGCRNLASLTLGNNIATLEEGAFVGCKALASVTLGNITTIGHYAFSGCTALTSVTLGDSVTNIIYAFNNCSALTDVYYAGTKAQWDQISISKQNNDALESATIYYNSAISCNHISEAATCKKPTTCALCGATDGKVGDHAWQAATCSTPKTCTVCGTTTGDALGHDWQVTTCTAPIACAVCEETRPAPGHVFDETGTCRYCDEVQSATLSIGTAYGVAGDTVRLTFALHGAVKSLALTDFVYDTDALELIGGEWADLGGVIAHWDATKQNAAIIFSENTPLNGAVFTLTFRIKEGASFTVLPVSCTAVAKVMANGSEVSLPLTVTDGSVVWGILGDTDGNGVADVDDAIYLLYHTLLPDQYPLVGGDFDHDGDTDGDDAIYLLYYTLLPDQYPLV